MGHQIITKYCDFAQIQTKDYCDLTDQQKKQWIDLLQSHYIKNDRIFMAWTPEYLDIIFGGYDNKCFVSFFKEKQFDLVRNDSSENISSTICRKNDAALLPISIVYNHVPMGCIASRPYTIYIYGGGNNREYFKESAYFFDIICVHRDFASRNISRNLIQTHEYNQRMGQTASPPSLVSLFKREGDLCSGIVPVLSYNSFMFRLRGIRTRRLPPHINIVRIFKENAQILQEFFENLPKIGEFGFIAIPPITTIVGQILAQKMFVFVLKHKCDSLGYYFFKDTAMNYEIDVNATTNKEYKILQLCASYSNVKSNTSNIFYRGFLHVLYEIIQLEPSYRVLIWDNIAHNTILFQRWKQDTPIWIENPAAYYLYNLVSPKSFSSNNGFII